MRVPRPAAGMIAVTFTEAKVYNFAARAVVDGHSLRLRWRMEQV